MRASVSPFFTTWGNAWASAPRASARAAKQSRGSQAARGRRSTGAGYQKTARRWAAAGLAVDPRAGTLYILRRHRVTRATSQRSGEDDEHGGRGRSEDLRARGGPPGACDPAAARVRGPALPEPRDQEREPRGRRPAD